MSRYLSRLLIGTAVCAWLLLAQGCGSSGSTRTTVVYGYPYDSYWRDPYYGHRCCRDVNVVVPPRRPPPGHRPPGSRPDRPVHLPSRPRPTPRPRPVQRGRR